MEAIPTTYAGSEATNVWGLTEASSKTTGVDDAVLPATVIHDAVLTLGLPVELSVASGLNAVAHCVDSRWAPRTDPINAALAAEGIQALNGALPAISTGSGLHHKICHVLGGAYDLPHARTHAIVRPHILAFNAPYAPEARNRIAAGFGTGRALDGLNALREILGAAEAFRDCGFAKESIPEAARLALPAVPASNPRKFTVESLEQILHAAYAGAAPATDL